MYIFSSAVPPRYISYLNTLPRYFITYIYNDCIYIQILSKHLVWDSHKKFHEVKSCAYVQTQIRTLVCAFMCICSLIVTSNYFFWFELRVETDFWLTDIEPWVST